MEGWGSLYLSTVILLTRVSFVVLPDGLGMGRSNNSLTSLPQEFLYALVVLEPLL
jgi:hypothetical protein